MVPIGQAELQGGRCFPCFQAGIEPLKVVEVLNRGQKACLPAKPLKDRTGSKGSKRRHHAAERAKSAALKRLRALYPAMYEMLYDEERVKRGLEPLPRRDGSHVLAAETYDLDPVYAAFLGGDE
jgi:hypothetical protein